MKVLLWPGFQPINSIKLIILVSGQIITGLTKRFTRTTSRHTIAPKFLFDNNDQYYVGKNAKESIKKGVFILYDLHEITPNMSMNEYLINTEGEMILLNFVK